jgi:hypothetical protein
LENWRINSVISSCIYWGLMQWILLQELQLQIFAPILNWLCYSKYFLNSTILNIYTLFYAFSLGCRFSHPFKRAIKITYRCVMISSMCYSNWIAWIVQDLWQYCREDGLNHPKKRVSDIFAYLNTVETKKYYTVLQGNEGASKRFGRKIFSELMLKCQNCLILAFKDCYHIVWTRL